ncbi:MAG: hypothetical protein HYW77_00510 [Parcubacteria group bacterium]|nr:hypothetical protein [Parcubacteria group bacterium]
MLKVKFLVLIFLFFFVFLFNFSADAKNYPDGTLLRASGDIKVYLITGNIKKWVSSLEVFNFYNYKWPDVKIVSKKEVEAIKEGDPIVLELVSPSPSPSSSPAVSGSLVPSPSATPFPVKINDKFPAPDYIRADWLISHATSNYGRVGQRIIFKYSSKEKDKIENFRLYQKKPGDDYFYKIADFEEVPSTNCEDIDIDGEWMITEAGQCGYWSIQKVTPPGGRSSTAFLSSDNYLVGEYVYYVAGVDKDGAETLPSLEVRLIFLDTIRVLNQTDNQPSTDIYPTFKWTVASGWPADSVADYLIMISDDKNSQNPVWAKQQKISGGKSELSFTYDGAGLNSTKKYLINIYGHYRKSEYDPDYISILFDVPEFWIKSFSWTYLFKTMFASIFHLIF